MNEVEAYVREQRRADRHADTSARLARQLDEAADTIERLTRERDEARAALAAVHIAKQLLEPALPFLNKRAGDE